MSTVQSVDQSRTEAFVERIVNDTAGVMTTALSYIGDQLGLFKDLAQRGPATSGELAARTGLQERYAREWLCGMSSAGYLEYDPLDQRFSLPAEHIPVLVDEGGPAFLCGVQQEFLGLLKPIGHVIQAFQSGGGVPQSAHDNDFFDGLSRFTGGWFNNLLVQQWLPAVPDAQAKLERGARLADVGCGYGRAIIKLAQEFPNSQFVGYDAFAPSIEHARANAAAAGLGDRVRFELRDVSQGLPEQQFDIVTTFDVVHDAVDPLGLLRSIRSALKPGGIFICLDMKSSPNIEENKGTVTTLLYGASILYCMTTSLAHGGEGLGTCGFHEDKVRELSAEAGFAKVRRTPVDDPFNILYEIRADDNQR